MTDDLVKRLISESVVWSGPCTFTDKDREVLRALCKEAADKIERLKKDKQLLGEALHFAKAEGFEWPVDPWTGVSDD